MFEPLYLAALTGIFIALCGICKILIEISQTLKRIEREYYDIKTNQSLQSKKI